MKTTKIICTNCGNIKIRPAKWKKSKRPFCSLKCVNEWNKKNHVGLGIKRSKSFKKKHSLAIMGDKNPMKNKKFREKMANTKRGTVNYKKREYYKTEQGKKDRENSSERMKKNNPLRNPEVMRKWIMSNQKKPTLPERKMIELLREIKLDSIYKYNGDFREGVMIAGRIPDFINVLIDKKVIEIFGEYWHRIKKLNTNHYTIEKTIQDYKDEGYKCLIVWDYEFKDIDALKKRVREFIWS